MGLKLAVAAVALALAAAPADFVASHQQADGGFAESGQSSDANLTAWAVLGLLAGGRTGDGGKSDEQDGASQSRHGRSDDIPCRAAGDGAAGLQR